MVKARKYVVKRKFDGIPKKQDYELVEYELPELKNGEVLAKAEWLSVDPYLRVFNDVTPVPYDQMGYQVAEVIQSKDPKYPVGSRIITHEGWCDYSIVRMDKKDFYYYSALQIKSKLPNLHGLSHSLAIGSIGMPGATAYIGLTEGLKPQPGETVVVTGAAGAVGSLVGQIAKLKGCKVIGFAGSDDKVKWLEEELGFDHAFNYKTVDVPRALKEAAPNGIDRYFDNVGGEISSQIMYQMKRGGRMIICGTISSYNEDQSEIPKMSTILPAILKKGLTVKGFNVYNWDKKYWDEAFVHLAEWIKSGQVKAREHITEGFVNVLDAFVDMLNGKNFGKAVVKV